MSKRRKTFGERLRERAKEEFWTGANGDNKFVWGAAALLAVALVYSLKQSKKFIDNALQSPRDALASGLYRLFGPDEEFGDSLYYTIGFPDGSRHAIPSSSVQKNATFQYQNMWYQMLMGKDGKRYAAFV